jgi:iron complex transport system substrate-binding protein
MRWFRKWRYGGMGNLLLAGELVLIAGTSSAQPSPPVLTQPQPQPQIQTRSGTRPVTVTDDGGQRVSLPAPARRVIALSPSLTELVFAAGGGQRLVGVAEHSNYPEAARTLPRIGDALSFQIERLLALDPDLIVAWQQGNNPRQLERLAALGIPIYYSQINRLEDVATTLERLGLLLDSPGKAAADDFRHRLASLRPAGTSPVRVLYQVWPQPLMTVNSRHVISDLIGRCGGVNVFADQAALVPQVGFEAAIAAAPEAIIAAGATGRSDAAGVAASAGGGAANAEDPRGGPLEQWRRYPAIPAVAHGFLFLVDGDAISRPGPRLLEAGAEICRQLDQVRRER